jgi:hypothetical protein
MAASRMLFIGGKVVFDVNVGSHEVSLIGESDPFARTQILQRDQDVVFGGRATALRFSP